MRTKNKLGIVVAAFTALACALPWSTKAEGNIWSIEPVTKDQDSQIVRDMSNTKDDPLKAGDIFKIRVRFLNSNWLNVVAGLEEPDGWNFVYIGAGSETMAKEYYPKLGLWVSGRLVYAELDELPKLVASDNNPSMYVFTDVIFKYTVQAGDIALPIKLANPNGTGPIDFDYDISGEYYVVNGRSKDNVWALKNKSNEIATWTFSSNTYIQNSYLNPPTPNRKWDFSDPGIYAQAIDFDSNYADEGNQIWRTVAQGLTSSSPIDPTITIPGGNAEPINLYVWSSDDAQIKVVAGGNVSVVQDREFAVPNGSTTMRKVGTLKLDANIEEATFKLEALGNATIGNTVSVYLSPTPTNIYDIAGNLVQNYLERKVQVVTPPKPFITTGFTTGAKSTITADGDYTKYKTVLQVTISQAFTEDLYFTLTGGMIDDENVTAGETWKQYIGTSYYNSESVYLEHKTSFKIDAGERTSQLIYVYALGADASTEEILRGIQLEAKLADDSTIAAKEFFAEGSHVATTLHINTAKPVVEMKDAPYTDSAAIQSGESTDFNIYLSDSYNSLQGTYKVYLNENSSFKGSESPVATGLKPTSDGRLVLSYTYQGVGLMKSHIKVVNEANLESADCSFDVYANAPRTLSGVVADSNVDKIYCEGQTALLNAKFEPAFTIASQAYVFLEPQDADSSNLVESVNLTRGSRIVSGATLTSVPLSVKLLDGTVNSKLNGLRFKLKVRNEETIDKGNPISGYTSEDYVLYVTNVVPTVQTVYMGGVFEPQLQTDGTLLMAGEAAVNIRKEFTYVPNDDEVEADYTNKQFTAKWIFYDGAVGFTTNVVGNPYNVTVPYTFVNAGKHKVTVQLQDKDLKTEGEMKFGPAYTFYIDVQDTPAIELSPHDGSSTFTEAQYGNNARIDVKLTMAPDAPIDVQLVVSRLGVGSDPKTYPLPTLSTNIVHFAKSKSEATFNLKEVDGTLLGSTEGYKITARVITKTVSPSIGLPFDEVYEPVEDFGFYLENVEPKITLPDPNDTNEYVTTLAAEQVIKWVVSDVCKADLQYGLTVTIMNSDGGYYSYTTYTGTGVFTNKFTSSGGGKWVSFQVEDKDGGTSVLAKKYYTIAPAKGVKIYPQRPFAGGGQSKLTQTYLSRANVAGGLGYGRVWAENNAKPDIVNFRHLWSYTEGVSAASLHAYGYRVGDVDNGTLNADQGTWHGYGLTPNGSIYTDGKAYEYADKELDSFFYAWILDSSEEGTDLTGTATIAPQSSYTPVAKDFKLPEDEEDAESYADTVIEALFALEWRAADNLGDINQDGIPDYYATAQWSGGVLYTVASQTEDGGTTTSGGEDAVDVSDLNNIASYNGDKDYLPLAFNYPNPLKPTEFGWGPGADFTARREIRGFHEGLNLNGISDPDFSEAEIMALFSDYLKAGNENKDTYDELFNVATNWAKANNWNLEAQSDPTVADTDDDNLDDGFEYFFWYFAKAGVIYNGQWQRMTGERFNVRTPGQGVVISSDLIAKAFNPRSARPDTQSADLGYNVKDFDEDGLTDLEEYALGTNPIHWDSDGDGVSDYYEVLYDGDPLDPLDGDANPDGDFMAYRQSSETFTVATVWDPTNKCEVVYAYPEAQGGLKIGELSEGDELDATVYETTFKIDGNEVVYYTAEDPVVMTDESMENIYLAKEVLAYSQIKIGDGDDAVYYLGKSTTLVPGVLITKRSDASATVKFAGTVDFTKGLRLFRYGSLEEGVWVPQAADGQTMEKFLDENGEEVQRVFPIRTYEKGVTIAYLHHQVYQMDEFDPRTAWYKDNAGYVASRWHDSAEGDTGLAVNTRAYGNKDEFLLLAYRYNVCAVTNDANEVISNRAYVNVDDDLSGDVYYIGQIFATRCTKSGTNTTALVLTTTDSTGSSDSSDSSTSSDDESTGRELGKITGAHGADTDEDGIPDGWELYVNLDPLDKEDASTTEDPFDKDGLKPVDEFAGTDSCNAYTNVTTIYENHPGINKGWYNKFFPTDPQASDTDGDGLVDDAEGADWNDTFYVGRNEYSDMPFNFIYGSNEVYAVDFATTCFRGGGLNPCTVDTDCDLLPDAWEHEFAGVLMDTADNKLDDGDLELIRLGNAMETGATPTSEIIVGGMDGTWSGDAYGMTKDSYTGTFRDTDWDHDGLQNYQEYLVQALRHLRYDDAETPLMGRYLVWTVGMSGPLGIDPRVPFMGFVPMQAWDGDAFYQTCLAAGYKGLNDKFDYSKMGYFARPPQKWDRLAQQTLGSMCSNYSEAGYRVMLRPMGLAAASGPDMEGSSAQRMTATGYATTDPRRWDSDDDGMDDYYEIFHGLNPLLGSAMDPSQGDVSTSTGTLSNMKYDRIAQIYGGKITAWSNAWTFFDLNPTQPAFDAIKYPWMMGTAECDADGDGLRNSEEALLPNVASPSATHTDPTPLWFTDSSSKNSASYTAQYYRFDPTWGDAADLAKCWDRGTTTIGGSQDGAVTKWMFAFEENEGYDTDHDFQKDSDELVKRVTTVSDPLNFTDPDRRQAMYFTGDKSAVVSSMGTQQRPNSLENDLLRQFTVEAWVCPEVAVTAEQVILERVANYGGSTLSNGTSIVRANFRLGLDATGHAYGEFEGTTADSGAVRLIGNVVEAGKWTHLAFTFDGTDARLYMNGDEAPVAMTRNVGLIPANGVTIQLVAAQADNFPVIQNGYATVPAAFLLGASAVDGNAIELSEKTTWASYQKFFQGWIDEVRVWDGARGATDIHDAYDKRMTMDEVQANHEEVYRAWSEGAKRNNNAGVNTLPCELLQHYNFQSLPSDVYEEMVAQEPSGYQANVLDNVRVNGSAIDLRCGWWSGLAVKSTVYQNYSIVPWLQNTVAHIPALDGSTVDSQYWSENAAGVSAAANSGVSSFSFPNTANPYPYWTYFRERQYHLNRWVLLASTSNNLFSAFSNLYSFDLRSGFLGTSDLVPLGGAFAKRTASMWDGNGASDASTVCAFDLDGDGINDFWEDQYTEDINWDTMVKYDDIQMTAAEAYLRDLAKGWMLDKDYKADRVKAFAATGKDTDNDGLPDWWEDIYAIQGTGGSTSDALADYDNDQLPNYVEYLVSEGFGFSKLDPSAMRTDSNDGQVVPDYFKKEGKLYYGEMFTDHDFMEDWWERLYATAYTSMFVSDAAKDADDDGWSSFAECRYSLWSAKLTADMITRWLDSSTLDEAIKEYPQPAIGVKLAYYGNQSVAGMPVVVRVSTGNLKEDDAVFTIAGSSSGSSTTTSSSSDSDDSKSAYLGLYRKGAVLHGHLNPGAILTDTVIVKSAVLDSQASYTWSYAEYSGSAELSYNAKAGYGVGTLDEFLSEQMKYPKIELVTQTVAWNECATTKADLNGHLGKIIYQGGETNVASTSSKDQSAEIGTIDYRTGEYELDMSKYAAVSSMGDAALEATVFMVEYEVAAVSEFPQTFYLSKPDTGRVREGTGYISAFIDMDGDGAWTAGEPYGCAVQYGAKIGWWKSLVDIELTDTAPQMYRINLASAMESNEFDGQKELNDRAVNGVQYNSNIGFDEGCEGTNMPATTVTDVRVRIVRKAVSGIGSRKVNTVVTRAERTLVDTMVNPVANPMLAEDVVLKSGVLDLDWGTLSSMATSLNVSFAAITSATYCVAIGNDDITSTNCNGLATMFVNTFEGGIAGNQSPAQPIAPQGIVNAASPTFTWTHENTIGKAYPAFRLRIWDGKTVVYDSGAQRAPARSAKGVYSWTAPIYAGMVLPNGQVFGTQTNYQWSVSMLDAKFTTPNTTETKASFRMNVSSEGGAVSDYGTIKVAAKYFGPATVTTVAKELEGLMRVQAFTTPDFTGVPAGEGYVTDITYLDNEKTNTVNAQIVGLPMDETYYVRVFLDTDGDGEAADWESWGYANYVGASDVEAVYNPKGVTLTAGSVKIPEVTVFVEDMDTDNDGYPDAYEIETKDSLAAVAPASGNTFFTKVNPQLNANVADFTLDPISNAYALMPIVNMTANMASFNAASLELVTDAQVSDNVYVTVTDYSLDEGIKFEVVSEVTATESAWVSVASEATVKVYLVVANTLDFSDAQEVLVDTLKINANATTKMSISAEKVAEALTADGIDKASFIKVKLVQE